MLLRNRENVQGEHATKGHVQDINLRQALEQSGRNVNVRDVNIREQEKEIVASVVLVIVGRGDVTAGPHDTATAGLRLNTLCAFPSGRY